MAKSEITHNMILNSNHISFYSLLARSPFSTSTLILCNTNFIWTLLPYQNLELNKPLTHVFFKWKITLGNFSTSNLKKYKKTGFSNFQMENKKLFENNFHIHERVYKDLEVVGCFLPSKMAQCVYALKIEYNNFDNVNWP